MWLQETFSIFSSYFLCPDHVPLLQSIVCNYNVHCKTKKEGSTIRAQSAEVGHLSIRSRSHLQDSGLLTSSVETVQLS